MGAGAYGYQQARDHEVLGSMGRMAGLFDSGSANRGPFASSSGSAPFSSEVGTVGRMRTVPLG